MLIKKERRKIGWSLHIVQWFPQSRDEIINNKNSKDEEMELGKESNEEVEKEEKESETNNESITILKGNNKEDEWI